MPARFPSGSRLLAIMATVVSLAAFPLSALAIHDFADVPDSNAFHADISALAASGVTTGCGGGNFCPSAFVTREQMAAFMNRLGALADGKVPVVNADRLDGLDSSQFVRSDVLVIGHDTCPARSMVPEGSSVGYATLADQSRYASSAGYFGCRMSLPDGATILVARWLVTDTSPSGWVADCRLDRTFLSEGVPGFQTIAYNGGTSAGGTLGNQTLEDVTISNALVDTETYGYQMLCYLSGHGSLVSLFQFQVEYSVGG